MNKDRVMRSANRIEGEVQTARGGLKDTRSEE